ncbi:MAG: hypothetical protein R3C26_14100 [Calditrichia bacterium]
MQFTPARWTFFLCCLCYFGAAQTASSPLLNYRISVESGWTSAHLSSLDNDISPTVRLNGKFSIRKKSRAFAWQLNGQFRPELFLSGDVPTHLKYGVAGTIQRSFRKWQWVVSASADARRLSIGFQTFTLQKWSAETQLIWQLNPRTQLKFGSGADLLNAKNILENRMTAGRFFVMWQRQFSRAFRGQLGLTGDPFVIKESFSGDSNAGYRMGAVVSITRQKTWIWQMRYHGILHHSEFTQSPSSEHWLHLLTGRIFANNWSVLFLADYRFRKFTFVENAPLNLLYSPYDDDRKVYLKIEKDFSNTSQLFFLFGYQSEDLFNLQSRYYGWRGLIGVEFGKSR